MAGLLTQPERKASVSEAPRREARAFTDKNTLFCINFFEFKTFEQSTQRTAFGNVYSGKTEKKRNCVSARRTWFICSCAFLCDAV